MQLEKPNELAEDIERGLGELHWLFNRVEPSMRLRSTGACGVGSIAVAEHFRRQGYEVDLVISSPRLWVDPEMQHVLAIVQGDNERLTVDVSYSQFLQYAGMSPGYVAFGGENLFPVRRIAEIHDDTVEEYVDMLTDCAVESMRHYKAPDEWFRAFGFDGLDEGDIRAVYSAIWDPAYFTEYQPSDDMLRAGYKLAKFILPEHARLIA